MGAGYHAVGTSGDAGEARAAIRGVWRDVTPTRFTRNHYATVLSTVVEDLRRLAGAALAGLAAAPSIAANPRSAQTAPPIATVGGRDPDAIVVNAKVYTMDTRAPRAEAFAVTNGRFTAVGTTGDIKGLAGKSTQTFDAKGMTLVPGFIDCHNHAGGEVLLNEVLVGNPFEVEFVTIRSIVDKLKAKAQQTPSGAWVEGFFFDDTKVKDKRALNIRDLDEVSRDHPVIVRHRGGHTYFYNSKAFELAGVTRTTPNPMGGTFDKDEKGELNGRVTDLASAAFNKVGTRPTFTPAQIEQRARDGVAHISKQFARYGLTSVHHQGGSLQAIQDVRARGDLLHRVSYETSGRALEAMIAAGIQTGFGDEWIKFGSASEHIVDGSFSERTMALSTPYPGVTPPYKGNVTETQDALNDSGRARAPRGHPGELPRQRRRRDRHVPHGRRASARAGASRQRAPEDHPLHAHQPRPGEAHQGDRRRPGAVHDLRVLQPGQVRVLRRRHDEELHGVSLAAGCGRVRGGRLGLQPRAIRPAHGDPGDGDEKGLGRHGVGRESTYQRR